nr:hypothetical protein CFP56_41521 [Quercus suber]
MYKTTDVYGEWVSTMNRGWRFTGDFNCPDSIRGVSTPEAGHSSATSLNARSCSGWSNFCERRIVTGNASMDFVALDTYVHGRRSMRTESFDESTRERQNRRWDNARGRHALTCGHTECPHISQNARNAVEQKTPVAINAAAGVEMKKVQ